MQQLLISVFWKIASTAPRMPMADVAPLVRRPVDIDLEASYSELGIRSFGNGTFHKPALTGSGVGSKRISELNLAIWSSATFLRGKAPLRSRDGRILAGLAHIVL